MNMPMEFLKVVVNELIAIRKNVPLKNRRQLNVEKFDGQSGLNCIYGQMFDSWRTGNSVKYKHINTPFTMGTPYSGTLENKNYNLGNKPHTDYNFNTPLEKYVYQAPKDKVTKLFKYLKSKGGAIPTVADLL